MKIVKQITKLLNKKLSNIVFFTIFFYCILGVTLILYKILHIVWKIFEENYFLSL